MGENFGKGGYIPQWKWEELDNVNGKRKESQSKRRDRKMKKKKGIIYGGITLKVMEGEES